MSDTLRSLFAGTKREPCKWCGGDVAIRNPTGNCDHLYYPDNVNKSLFRRNEDRTLYYDEEKDCSVCDGTGGKYPYENNGSYNPSCQDCKGTGRKSHDEPGADVNDKEDTWNEERARNEVCGHGNNKIVCLNHGQCAKQKRGGEPSADVNDRGRLCEHGNNAKNCLSCYQIEREKEECKHDWHPMTCESIEFGKFSYAGQTHGKAGRMNTVKEVYCKKCLITKNL